MLIDHKMVEKNWKRNNKYKKMSAAEDLYEVLNLGNIIFI